MFGANIQEKRAFAVAFNAAATTSKAGKTQNRFILRSFVLCALSDRCGNCNRFRDRTPFLRDKLSVLPFHVVILSPGCEGVMFTLILLVVISDMVWDSALFRSRHSDFC